MFTRLVMLLALAAGCVCLVAMGVGSAVLVRLVLAFGLMTAFAVLIAWPFFKQRNDHQ